ncbi:MAG: PAS domain S-box protein [Mariniphaga sp.]|nr:PAS domain S-box protein [Mariniphaga sp.]
MEKQHDLTTALNILSLEDSPEDYKIIFELLLAAGIDFTMNRVENEHDFVSALNSAKYDVILADFNLPQYDAFEALKKAIEICPEIPFICVSGSIGEETAIELIKLGAVDYILKDKPVKLPYAIKRAIREAEENEERKQIEDELRKSETLKSKMVANIGDVIVIIDHEGINRYESPNAEKLFGWKPEDNVGFSAFDNVHPDDLDDAQRFIASIESEPGKVGTTEVRYRHKDGHYSWIQFTCSNLIHDPDIQGILGNYHDITLRKESELELIIAKEKANRNMEMILNSQSLAHICSYSTNLNETDLEKSSWVCSPEFYKIFGIDETYPHTIAGWAGFIHPDHREELVAYHEYVVKNRISFRHEYKIIRINDGLERWVHGTGELVYDEQGKPARMQGAIQDITEIKKTEEELISAKEQAEESEEKYKQIFDNTFDIMSIYEVTEDHRYKVVTFNHAEAKLIGDLENFQNRYIDECIPPELYNQFTQHYERCIQEDKRIEYEEHIAFLTINKSFNTQLIPLKNAEGRIHRIIVISRDITENITLNTQLTSQNEELKSLNYDLTIAKEHAEESDRLKSAFLANMSHEIRTPMNGILGFAELLKEPGLSGEEQQEFISIIEKSGARMLNIINDIVSISKIEAGLMTENIQESNINEQIEYIYTFFKPEVEGKGIQFSFKNSLPFKEAILKTDREKVYAILTNLIKNAIKYSEKGSIEFGYILKKDNEPVEVEFYVKDTGIGIPVNRQKAIFERFIQADIADKMARQGAGLGLSISKAYIEMLGGKIWVESEVGIGSIFYFTLPYKSIKMEEKNAENEVLTPVEVTPVKKLKILIAEDDEPSERLISLAVHKFGREIISVKTGTKSVAACLNNPDIDLVLMDILMPEMDGYEATRQIRKFNKDVIIIAQTAYALEGDKEKAIAAGCNGYITKPIKSEELKQMMIKYLKKND